MEEFTIASECGHYERVVWLQRGPTDEPHRLCIFLDGEHYMESVGVLPLLDSLFAQPDVPPMTCLFVSYESAQARQEEYTCNEAYAAYIAKDVFRWVTQQVPSLQTRDHVVCGISLSGLFSAYVTLQYPKIFSRALCHSGSFWWQSDRFAALTARCAPIDSRFWLSVGDQETATGVSHPPLMYQEMSQIEGVRKAVDALRDAGGHVHHHMYQGGHEFGPWTDEFVDAMRWLLALEPHQSHDDE